MAHLLDCNLCKRQNSREVRRYMRCGYEPVIDVASMSIPSEAWSHRAFTPDTDAAGNPIPVAVCPGYTCGLPEVIEVSRARLHWGKGALGLFVEKPSEALMAGIEILEGESRRVEAWLNKPAKDGGGGP